jgi:diguanylate cyclase (GGDEF)-like protein/PAS domain S-box-containing protein
MAGVETWVLLIEAFSVYGLVLFAHSLRRLFGLAHFYALLGALTAVMSWVTDAHVKVTVGPVTFLVGSTVFFTALLLAVFVIYVFDGPKAARTAISTIVGISILVPLFAMTLHLQMLLSSTSPLGAVPVPSLRINSASVLTTMADMVFLAVAWEYMHDRFQGVPLLVRTFFTLLGVMLLDVVLFNTGAFAGEAGYWSILAGTFSERVVVALVATPVLWVYLHWQTQHRGESIRRQPILAILRELTDVRQELGAAQQELEYRRHMMQQLHDSEQRYRELIEHALEGIMVVQAGQVMLANPRASGLLRSTHKGCLGARFVNFFAQDERPGLAELLRLTEQDSGAPDADAFELIDGDGASRWLQIRAVAIDWRGRPAALLFLADVTEQRRAEQQLLRRANTDSLTGLYSRPHFLELAERGFADAVRRDQPVALISFDADHFKSVNDRYGHPVGDAVLQHLARLLKRDLREIDLVGRMGGEEFAVLLPGADMVQARSVAERLRTIVSLTPAMTDRGAIQLTVSAGVAERREWMSNFGALVQASDDALLSAKQAGRNRVEDASSPTSA